MITRAKTFGSPSGEPSTTRPYDSTNVRKTLDTTVGWNRSNHPRIALFIHADPGSRDLCGG